ncbi:MAG: hypothetical protein H0U98_00230 [Alphaproteobacteria bacterium]|nr:hypothetical protein [Alphaproteobacteria bacterium]
MRRYRINCLDIAGQISRVHEVQCGDDLDALDEGEKACEENDVEVWDGSRLVARFKAGNAPLTVQDHHSL